MENESLAGNVTPTEFVTGAAGTGKTWELKRRIAEDKKGTYGVLCATTGISAVNLDTITLNSLIKYFDTDSLWDKFLAGHLEMRLRELAESYHNLCIDEVSMLPAEQLDLIYKSVNAVNQTKAKGRYTLGMVLAGDFAQLPPVKARWAFEAECWSEFERNITLLETFRRQSSRTFLQALQLARVGDGTKAAEAFRSCPGVTWAANLNRTFDGTTIVAKNEQVDRFNWMALQQLKGEAIRVPSHRWGKLRAEWKYIPEVLEVKPNALVMLLANDTLDGFKYANGDLGHIAEQKATGQLGVKLKRSGEVVWIGELTRYVTEREADEEEVKRYGGWWSEKMRRYILGGITYYPLRLAYASTVHKTQSLTLDSIQIDLRDHFMSNPGSVYVALSRARKPEGLRIVGSPKLLAARIKSAKEVERWL